MPDYSFLNLSPAEFEVLTRDLLQKELGLHLESFTSGRDGGIDLRHSRSRKREVIVQCKRYTGFASLKANLEQEVEKVKKLKPERYIICTSVGLTPGQKNQLLTLFNPFILAPGDIFGRDDLNNLLSKFPEVERSHFKLWLSSTEILQRILHSKIYNQSAFEEEKIKETVRLFVSNDSFGDGLKLIERHRYLLISGSPGIGKTTLARVISYHYLANGYEDFIFLSGSIDEAYSLYNADRKQLFLFDDFLGKTFLHLKLGRNEDERIIRFIERIAKSDNKLLILTTREYILAQARLSYEVFEKPAIRLANCILDLEGYTKQVRSKILYNHIFFSNLDQAYIENLLEKSSYQRIIAHKNYSPRIIETVLENISTIRPEEFVSKFIGYLDYQDSIWKHVYESQITPFSQLILANLLTAGTPIAMNDLELLIRAFAERFASKYGIVYSQIAFNKAITELENTFIRSSRDSKDKLVIDYANPSIQDFLVTYLNDLQDMMGDVIDTACFFNQLVSFFAYEGPGTPSQRPRRTHLAVTPYLATKLVNRLTQNFVELPSSTLKKRLNSNTEPYYYQVRRSVYNKLNFLRHSNLYTNNIAMRNFTLEFFKLIMIPNHVQSEDIGHYVSLVIYFHNEIPFEEEKILAALAPNIETLSDYHDFKQLEALYTETYAKFISKSAAYKEAVRQMVDWEAENVDTLDIRDFVDDIHAIVDHTKIDLANVIIDLEEKFQERDRDYDPDEIYDHDEDVRSEYRAEEENISDMFDSLK
ncbi:hypothetical protein GCM10022289_19230 [Pedobacter jeongneungensis]|uniref:Restriction endonuclease n=1 Tax=Pedobacter jeongneungensis TaxID=947309 RepID=A0ABP8BCS1_9SPHI